MDAYDRCTNLGKKIFLIILLSMVEAKNFSDHPRTLPFYRGINRRKEHVISLHTGLYHRLHSKYLNDLTIKNIEQTVYETCTPWPSNLNPYNYSWTLNYTVYVKNSHSLQELK